MEDVYLEFEIRNQKKYDKQELLELVKCQSKRVILSTPVTNERTSKYWSFFKLVLVDQVQQDFAMCISCKTLIVYKTQTGTGGLKKHINACVERTAMKDQTTLDDFIGSTKLSGSSTENNRKSGASSLPKYLRRNLNRAFVEFSALDCRSFETTSGLGFTRLINQVFRAGQSMKSNSFNIESLIPSTRTV